MNQRAASSESTWVPAIGKSSRYSRRATLRLVGIALIAIVALAAAKVYVGIAQKPTALIAVPEASRLGPDLILGGVPTDAGLLALATAANVRGVVRVGSVDSVSERATTRYLGIRYLFLQVLPGGAPSPSQQARLMGFIRQIEHANRSVYLQGDDAGRAYVSGDMEQVLSGRPWSTIGPGGNPTTWAMLSRMQRVALERLRPTSN